MAVGLKIKLVKNIDNLKINTDAFTELVAKSIQDELVKRRVTPYKTGKLQQTAYTKFKSNGQKCTQIIWPMSYARYVWNMQDRLNKKINWTTYYNPNATQFWPYFVISDAAYMKKIANACKKAIKVTK